MAQDADCRDVFTFFQKKAPKIVWHTGARKRSNLYGRADGERRNKMKR